MSFPLLATVIAAQIGDRAVGFEVASIRPHQGPVSRIGLVLSGKRVRIDAYSALDLITDAYNIKDYQLVSPRGWSNTDRFDIVGTLDVQTTPTRSDASRALQSLLRDRFQLKFRRETREVSGYALLRSGQDATKLVENTNGTPRTTVTNRGRQVEMAFTSAPLEQLAAHLARVPEISRPVVDESGLSGRYDFTLLLAATSRNQRDVIPPQEVSVFTAIKEQLGLKLEPRKLLVESIVVESIAHPSEN